jgi:putative tryptophan/tyrosine transport system substrate-binding protein
MRRRDVIAGLLVAATMASARAQQTGKVYRIAIVTPAGPLADISESGVRRSWRAFFGELRRLGYVEGRNLAVERYSGEGKADYHAELARDVVRSTPDVIVPTGTRVALDFKAATLTIPIVSFVNDPVASGVAPSLARPGGNITGVSADGGLEIWGKRIQLLREAVPKMSRVGFLATRRSWDSPPGAAAREAASKAGMTLVSSPLEAPVDETEYRRMFTTMMHEHADALVVGDQGENAANRRWIVALAEKERLPAIYAYRDDVELGGLMAYGIDMSDVYRGMAQQVDQILRGTKPGEIPFHQPTKFELVINLKTAKSLGLTIPPSILARADEVIE